MSCCWLLVKHRSIFYNSNQDNYNDMSGKEENIAAEDAVVSQYFTISGNMQNIALLMMNDSGEDITIHAVLRDADTAEVLSIYSVMFQSLPEPKRW